MNKRSLMLLIAALLLISACRGELTVIEYGEPLPTPTPKATATPRP